MVTLQEYIAETEKWLLALDKERVNMFRGVSSHLNTLELVAVKQTTDHVATDPWLTKRLMDQQLHALVEHENHCQRNLVCVQTEIAKFDAFMAESLNNTFGKLFDVVRDGQERFQRDMNSLRNEAQSLTLDTPAEFRAYCERFGIYNAPCFHQTRTYEEFANHFEPMLESKSMDIAKEGTLTTFISPLSNDDHRICPP